MRCLVCFFVLVAACGDDDGLVVDGGMSMDMGMALVIEGPSCEGVPAPADGECSPGPTDYVPGTDDGYAACVSDGGDYVRIEETISTVGRVAQFEQIATLLFGRDLEPVAAEFEEALRIYRAEEGLDSRVVRRYDPRFSVPEGTDCTLPDVPASFPDYCVGPAQLLPILNEAFVAGARGESPRTQAGRIEAALLWFLYASVNKESFTCTSKAKDCDSSYAYYTGGEPARGGVGLARYVAAADALAHERAWDGLLALRCWRDLDDGEVAEDLELRERARSQLDRAVSDGLAAVLRARLVGMCGERGGALEESWAFVRTLAPALDATMQLADEALARAFREELARARPQDLDLSVAVGALDAVYECP